MDTPVMAVPVAFDRVIVTVEGFPTEMVAGENAFETANAPVTARLALTLAGLEMF
jgi:hypothetical protein